MPTQTRYPTKDAFMGKEVGGPASSSGWNGKDDHLIVGVRTSGTFKYRSCVFFNIDFVPMQTIVSATLSLFTTAGQHVSPTQANNVIVARMTADWGEGTNDPGEGFLDHTLPWGWENRFDKYNTQGQAVKAIVMSGSGDEKLFDVTSIVQSWFGGTPNYGFHIRNADDSAPTDNRLAVEFFSRRNSGSSFRPKLEIVYTTGSPPSAPVLNAPVDLSIINTTVPTLQGTAVDDVGDHISSVHIQVRKPNLRRWKFSTTTTASDPGAGFIRVNNLSSPTQIYLSETDYDAVSAVSFLGSAYPKVVKITGPTGQLGFWGVLDTATDNGTWRTIPVLGIFTYLTSDMNLLANNDIILFESDSESEDLSGSETQLMWDSGLVVSSGTPTTFAIPYGVQGTASTLFGSTYYKWRARTKDSAANIGPFSEWEFFKPNTVPNQPSVTFQESPTSDLPTISPSFIVTHNDIDPLDTKMFAYQVLVEKEIAAGDWSLTGGWDSGQVDTSSSLATSKLVTSGTLSWGGTFRVKARTQDSAGAWSSYSISQTFTTHTTSTPINLNPTGSVVTSTTPTFTGSRASSVDTITAFTIEVLNSDNTVKEPATRYTVGTDGNTFSKTYSGAALTPGSTYKWRVFIESTIGGDSAYSATQVFIVAGPTIPEFSAPVGTGLGLTPTITFSRAAMFNRARYTLFESDGTTVLFSSGTLSSGISGSGPYVFSASYGGAPALVYGTTYKISAAVSDDGGSLWSPDTWTTFTTDFALTAVLTSVGGVAVGGLPWITDTTPDFVVTRAGSETIDKIQIRVFNSSGYTQIWDSGLINVADSTSGTVTYAGSDLTPGTTYKWTASYQKTTGPQGPEATLEPFRLNASPSSPVDLYPPTGNVWTSTELQYFRASFGDADVIEMGDYPTLWEIIVQELDGSPTYSTTKSTGLIVGLNEHIWDGTALTPAVDYQWRTRFTDSKGAAGAYSGWQSLKVSTAPNATDVIPTDGSNVNDTTPAISWTFTGGTQLGFRIIVDETESDGTFIKNVFTSRPVTSATPSYTMPSGHIKNTKYYDITVIVQNTDLIYDPTPPTVNVHAVFSAPDPVTGFVATTDVLRSSIEFDWDNTSVSTGVFQEYRVYKKLHNDDEWQYVGSQTNRTKHSPKYVDWYAGHGVPYIYRVVAVARVSGALLESPDHEDGESITTTFLDIDDWIFIGEDRDDSHIQVLYTDEEEHSRPIQQEAFETLGSNRKVIVRGFVLGNEGSLTTIWTNTDVALFDDFQTLYNHTVLGRRIVDYLSFNAGPHVLKSPFGDVWDSEFSSPTFNWLPGGHLEVQLEWVETGTTSAVSI